MIKKVYSIIAIALLSLVTAQTGNGADQIFSQAMEVSLVNDKEIEVDTYMEKSISRNNTSTYYYNQIFVIDGPGVSCSYMEVNEGVPAFVNGSAKRGRVMMDTGGLDWTCFGGAIPPAMVSVECIANDESPIHDVIKGYNAHVLIKENDADCMIYLDDESYEAPGYLATEQYSYDNGN